MRDDWSWAPLRNSITILCCEANESRCLVEKEHPTECRNFRVRMSFFGLAHTF